jgi:aldehyde:ferredoxin oxidoreductase
MAVAEEFFARTLTAVTGEKFTADDLMMVGERVWTLERLYNLREGFTKEDDTLPDRLLNDPVAAGPSEGFTANLAPMLKEYYAFRGWDENGVPKQEKLRELGLEFAIEAAHD